VVIFLRAIPFSFSILWRYIVALPALILALFAFAFLAFIVIVVAMLVSPLFGFLLAMAFGVGVSVVPVMVGLRVGLQAHHIRPRVSYFGMMKPAIGYSIFETAVMLVLFVASVAVFILLTPLDMADLAALEARDTDALVADLTAISPVLTWVLIGVVALVSFALRAALLVPFAGASVGKDPTDRAHTPFYGFGNGFVPVFLLVLLSYVGLSFAVPLVLVGLAMAGLAQNALAEIARIATFDELVDFATLGLDAIILIAVTLFVMLFFFSLQCAGAVLVYMRERDAIVARQKAFDKELRKEEETLRTPVMEKDDMLALVRSRMPERKY
jgi:hypothetical protein